MDNTDVFEVGDLVRMFYPNSQQERTRQHLLKITRTLLWVVSGCRPKVFTSSFDFMDPAYLVFSFRVASYWICPLSKNQGKLHSSQLRWTLVCAVMGRSESALIFWMQGNPIPPLFIIFIQPM